MLKTGIIYDETGNFVLVVFLFCFPSGPVIIKFLYESQNSLLHTSVFRIGNVNFLVAL